MRDVVKIIHKDSKIMYKRRIPKNARKNIYHTILNSEVHDSGKEVMH